MSRQPQTMESPRADRATERTEPGRARRVPLGAAQMKLGAEKRPGYVRRWINDMGGRIHAAEGAGYTFVEDANAEGRGTKRSVRVGTREDGQPLLAYLMEIRQEFYNEDQAAKEANNARIDEAIRRAIPQGAEAQDNGHFYMPSEGASVRRD